MQCSFYCWRWAWLQSAHMHCPSSSPPSDVGGSADLCRNQSSREEKWWEVCASVGDESGGVVKTVKGERTCFDRWERKLKLELCFLSSSPPCSFFFVSGCSAAILWPWPILFLSRKNNGKNTTFDGQTFNVQEKDCVLPVSVCPSPSCVVLRYQKNKVPQKHVFIQRLVRSVACCIIIPTRDNIHPNYILIREHRLSEMYSIFLPFDELTKMESCFKSLMLRGEMDMSVAPCAVAFGWGQEIVFLPKLS